MKCPESVSRQCYQCLSVKDVTEYCGISKLECISYGTVTPGINPNECPNTIIFGVNFKIYLTKIIVNTNTFKQYFTNLPHVIEPMLQFTLSSQTCLQTFKGTGLLQFLHSQLGVHSSFGVITSLYCHVSITLYWHADITHGQHLHE